MSGLRGSPRRRSGSARALTTAGLWAASVALAFGPASPALAASGGHGAGSDHNPPGNNGTVKIHDVAADPSQHDVPHVTCDFYVDFWGFDAGQTLTVSFAGQAPTGKGVPVTFTAPDGYSITSPDAAGGGNDFDGELGFTPTDSQLAVLGAPQPQQGYHVKLTVSTDQPSEHPNGKYKVFWIQPCTSSGGGGDTGGGDTGGGGGDTGGGGGDTGRGGDTGGGHHNGGGGTPAVHHTHKPAAQPATHVLGLHLTRAPHRPATAVLGTSSSLPFTGSHDESLSLIAAGCIAAGIGLMAAGRRPRSSYSTS
jgi:hypothetical protein